MVLLLLMFLFLISVTFVLDLCQCSYYNCFSFRLFLWTFWMSNVLIMTLTCTLQLSSSVPPAGGDGGAEAHHFLPNRLQIHIRLSKTRVWSCLIAGFDWPVVRETNLKSSTCDSSYVFTIWNTIFTPFKNNVQHYHTLLWSLGGHLSVKRLFIRDLWAPFTKFMCHVSYGRTRPGRPLCNWFIILFLIVFKLFLVKANKITWF